MPATSATDMFLSRHLAAVGGVFEFSKNAAANLRQTKDEYNPAIGGFLAGSVLGIRGSF